MILNKRLTGEAGQARFDLIVTILASGFLGLLIVLQAFTLSIIVDGVFLSEWDLKDALPWIMGFLLLSVLRAFFIWLKENSAQGVAGKVKSNLRKRLIDQLTNLGPSFTRAEHSGELSNTLTQGIEALDAYYRRYLPQLVIAVLVPLTILIFIMPLDTLTGMILLFTAPLIPFFMVLIGDTTERLTQRQWTTLSRLSAHFQDTLQGLKTLKLLGGSEDQSKKIYRASDDYRQATMGVLRVGFLSALVLELIATLSTAIVAVEVGLRTLTGRMEFQVGLFILLLAPEFYFPLRLLGTYFHSGVTGIAAATRIYWLLDKPVTPPTHSSSRFGKDTSYSLIQFHKVSYRYPERGHPESKSGTPIQMSPHRALDSIEFEFPAGKTLALVGPSGCGKSTIGALLLGFIKPESGSIQVDGTPLAEFDLRSWRSNIAWVPQAPTLFFGSVRDNILLGDPRASQDAVLQAAKLALAHDFICDLPEGYDTSIGQRGARLSGGQRKRIALARAFLKDAPLLILDEVSADLDPDTESTLVERIQEHSLGRTTMIIAHRLATIESVDEIIVLADGRIVETGSHYELLSLKGLYAQLVDSYRGSLAAARVLP